MTSSMARPLWAVLCAAGLLAAGMANTAVAHAGNTSCAALGGNVQSGTLCHVTETDPKYTLDMRFAIDYPDAAPVTTYLQQVRGNLVNAANDGGARYLPYETYVTSESYSSGQPQRTTQEYGQPWSGTRTLVLKVFDDIFSQPVRVRYKTFTYDHNSGRPIQFGDLFAPGTNPMDAIYSVVAPELAKQLQPWRFQLAPDVGKDPKNYQNFAITDDTVTFFFDQGQFLMDKAGTLEVPVARMSLPPLAI